MQRARSVRRRQTSGLGTLIRHPYRPAAIGSRHRRCALLRCGPQYWPLTQRIAIPCPRGCPRSSGRVAERQHRHHTHHSDAHRRLTAQPSRFTVRPPPCRSRAPAIICRDPERISATRTVAAGHAGHTGKAEAVKNYHFGISEASFRSELRSGFPVASYEFQTVTPRRLSGGRVGNCFSTTMLKQTGCWPTDGQDAIDRSEK